MEYTDIFLYRQKATEKSTIGKLTIPDIKFQCWVLELPYPIRAGRYEIIYNWSNRFKKNMPLLLNVPHKQGIRIHKGNTAKDTDGCLLVGCRLDPDVPDFVGSSTTTFEQVETILKMLLENGKVFINISE